MTYACICKSPSELGSEMDPSALDSDNFWLLSKSWLIITPWSRSLGQNISSNPWRTNTLFLTASNIKITYQQKEREDFIHYPTATTIRRSFQRNNEQSIQAKHLSKLMLEVSKSLDRNKSSPYVRRSFHKRDSKNHFRAKKIIVYL